MKTLKKYRQQIQEILAEYLAIPYHYGELKQELIVSDDRNHYLLIRAC